MRNNFLYRTYIYTILTQELCPNYYISLFSRIPSQFCINNRQFTVSIPKYAFLISSIKLKLSIPIKVKCLYS